MVKEVELLIREAQSEDGKEVLEFLNQVGKESDYMTLDDEGIGMSSEDLSEFLCLQESSANRICLLLYLDSTLAGLLNITAENKKKVHHIGEVFVVVKKAFWNQGLGRILLEEGLDWATSTGILRKLVLNVQVRNERAVHLYQSLGFEIEGRQARGAYSAEGEFLDIYLMGKLID